MLEQGVIAGDSAFMLLSTVLVFIMTPGLAFFYGGLGRRKNVISNLFASIVCMCVCIFLWIVIGYSLTFSGDTFGIFGSLANLFLEGVSTSEPGAYAPSIPAMLFVAFQMMFAVITPALFTGSIAGRMRFVSLIVMIVVWSIIVYYPLAHMFWGTGGILGVEGLGAVDFAGGNVIHISSAVTGLMLAIFIGRRKGFEHGVGYRIHNVPFVALGMALLWFGWFGFNAGSALGISSGLAIHAFMTTAAAGATGMVSWMVIDKVTQNRFTLVGASTGAVAGLASVTLGSGYIPIWAALLTGLVASPICYFIIKLVKSRIKIDDALDVFGCHGIGGVLGGILTGLFGSTAINSVLPYDGLVFSGDFTQLGIQLLAALLTIVWTAVGTAICIGITRLFGSLRAEERDEKVGLDLSQHGETAYPSFNGLD
ncbi:MAG: ammonium transporter [Coriobacteriales bacterium]|jgi:Amt family ammonium transporter|nr:ammonium transporter [Coriobacteriales bacterium]